MFRIVQQQRFLDEYPHADGDEINSENVHYRINITDLDLEISIPTHSSYLEAKAVALRPCLGRVPIPNAESLDVFLRETRAQAKLFLLFAITIRRGQAFDDAKFRLVNDRIQQ